MSKQEVEWIVMQAAEDVNAACRALSGEDLNHTVVPFTREWKQADFLSYLFCLALIAAAAVKGDDESKSEVLIDVIDPGTLPAGEFDPTFAALQIISAASREDAAADVFALVPEDEERATQTAARLISLTAQLVMAAKEEKRPPGAEPRGR